MIIIATIRTAIQVNDQMSGAFKAMNNALNIVVNSFASLQDATHQAVDTASIEGARNALAKAEIEINSIEQSINEASQAQQQFNNKLNSAQPPASNLLNKIKQIGGTIAGAMGVKKVIELADEYSNTTARLDLMNDGLQTTEELQRMIYNSAQRSRGAYSDVANNVARLGIVAKDAFSSNAETVAFAEQLNKHFVIGGASAQEMSAVSLQLSQALGSGVLRGDELNSVFEQAPTIIQAIADYMNVPIGKIREMASNGEITADIVKNAMLSAADETNAKFEQIPMTFGQIATSIQNKATRMFEPVLKQLNEIANSDAFNNFIDGALGGMRALSVVATNVINILVSAGSFIYDNWSILGPVIMGVATALGLYYGTLLAVNTAQAIHNGLQTIAALKASIHAAALMMQSGATFLATIAQHGLNAALLACPITWIVIGIIALIAVFFAAVGAVNKFADTSISAIGLVCGAVSVAGAFIGNIVIGLLNFISGLGIEFLNLLLTFADFFGNVFNNPVQAITKLFADLFDFILGVVQSAASAIDALLGSDLSGAVGGFRNKVSAFVETKTADVTTRPKIDQNKYKLDRLEYGNAWDAGYNYGKGLDNKMSSAFAMPDFSAGLGLNDTYNNGILNGLGGISDDLANINDNTGRTADNTSVSSEDLQYLRDIAERETINRYSSTTIKVDMTNNNTVNNSMDLDGIADHLAMAIEEKMNISAEGVY